MRWHPQRRSARIDCGNPFYRPQEISMRLPVLAFFLIIAALLASTEAGNAQ
jgi:hypothetical protein